jgi:ligand-binding sensor domain-containing protein
MSLHPDGDRLWIGTQKRGLGEYSYRDGRFIWHDERHGLPDDWITCIARSGGVLYAGTFVGGLARYDGKKWHDIPQLRGENVTALEPDGQGGLFIATRNGVWRQLPQGELSKLSQPWLDAEAQALWYSEKGLWIGTRTGLFFLRNASLALEPDDKTRSTNAIAG